MNFNFRNRGNKAHILVRVVFSYILLYGLNVVNVNVVTSHLFVSLSRNVGYL